MSTLVSHHGSSSSAFLALEASMKKKQKSPADLAAEAQRVLRSLRALSTFDQRTILQAALALLRGTTVS